MIHSSRIFQELLPNMVVKGWIPSSISWTRVLMENSLLHVHALTDVQKEVIIGVSFLPQNVKINAGFGARRNVSTDFQKTEVKLV